MPPSLLGDYSLYRGTPTTLVTLPGLTNITFLQFSRYNIMKAMKSLLKVGWPVLLLIILLAPLSCRGGAPSASTLPPVPSVAPSLSPVSASSSPRNIILIGWDGAQRNHVDECLSRGELPNLKGLASDGNLVAIDIYRTTDTKAGWSQILTGYEPEVTGVFSNSRYQPIPKGHTIFERLEDFFGPDSVTVAVSGTEEHVDNEGPQRRPYREGDTLAPGETVVTQNGTKYREIPGKPYYNASARMDVFVNGLQEDEKVGTKAVELLERHRDRPFFFFVHFAQVDHKGHQFGENSEEDNYALISADNWTGRITQKLRELDLYDKTLVYVTSDHGFDEGQKSHNDAHTSSWGPMILSSCDVDNARTLVRLFWTDSAST